MPAARIDAVVLDLGGVLADFGGTAAMRELAAVESEDEMWRRWLSCRWFRTFERGGCSPADFAAGVVADWDLPVTPDAFLAAFSSWIVAPFPGAAELVRQVKVARPVGCLSNTNLLHWEQRISRWDLLELFDFRFLSFEMGLVKPDVEVFGHVARALAVAPGNLVFLDDNLVNVAAATRAGLVARQARGIGEARRALVELGVI